MIEDLKQHELDLVEQKILTDIFGGYSPEYFKINIAGIFTKDLSEYVQKYIFLFEETIKPFMDEQGMIDGQKLKSIIKPEIAKYIPEMKFRPKDIYDILQPLIIKIKGAK